MSLQILDRSYSGPNSSIYWRMFDERGRWVMGGLTHPSGLPALVAFQLRRSDDIHGLQDG